MKKRIWELDVFRGFCILGVVVVHFVYDLTDLYGILRWDAPALFQFVQNWGGVLFLLLSGICATLGSRSVRRGIIVFTCGMICTAVTFYMTKLGFDSSIIIYFGVLHCLGTCMILWWLFKRLPTWFLAVLGIAMAVAGLYLQTRTFDTGLWLMPLGFMPDGFASSDYFPLLPNLGYFLLGGVLGRTLYRKQETLLLKVNENNPVLRFLRLCGRHSLWIYLLHQPVLSGLCWLLSLLK